MTSVQLCHECGKMFSCETYLEYHRIVAHSPHHLACRKCQKPFPTKKTASNHKMAHARNSHSCNICGKLQNSGFLLYVHLVAKHSVARQLMCALCDKKYSNSRSLKQHLHRIHKSWISRFEKVAELCCTVHSASSFPEEDLELDVLLSQVRNREGDFRFEQNGSVAITNGAEPTRGGASIAHSQQNESKSIENRVEDVRFEQNGSVAEANGAEPIRRSARLTRSQQNDSKSIENRVDFAEENMRFDSSELEDSAPIENKVELCVAFQNSKLHLLVRKKKDIVQKATPLEVVQKSISSETKLIPRKRIPKPLRELNEDDHAQNSNKTGEGHPTDIPIKITHDAREDVKRLFLPDYSSTFSHEQERTAYTCEICGMKFENEDVFIKSHQPPDMQSENCMICVTVETSQT